MIINVHSICAHIVECTFFTNESSLCSLFRVYTCTRIIYVLCIFTVKGDFLLKFSLLKLYEFFKSSREWTKSTLKNNKMQYQFMCVMLRITNAFSKFLLFVPFNFFSCWNKTCSLRHLVVKMSTLTFSYIACKTFY